MEKSKKSEAFCDEIARINGWKARYNHYGPDYFLSGDELQTLISLDRRSEYMIARCDLSAKNFGTGATSWHSLSLKYSMPESLAARKLRQLLVDYRNKLLTKVQQEREDERRHQTSEEFIAAAPFLIAKDGVLQSHDGRFQIDVLPSGSVRTELTLSVKETLDLLAVLRRHFWGQK